jgi:conjugative relaxase-like TrwC/TraI family protein
LSASQAITYHEEKFTNGADNYYSSSATITGQWHGRLAWDFGLTGEVDDAQFRRLAEGRHPVTDAPMLKAQASTTYVNARGETVTPMEHRAGWDATFSAPKSVSLVALVGGDDRVRGAHREAVAAALRELEPYVQARMGGSRLAETRERESAEQPKMTRPRWPG